MKLKISDCKKNVDKYYDYHQDNGYNIGECYHLKKLIEKMIKAGQLNQFFKDLRDNLDLREHMENETEDRERYQGEVKTIFGGSLIDRDSKTARKRFARQVYDLISLILPSRPSRSLLQKMIMRM